MGRDFAKKGRHKGQHNKATSSNHWVWLLAGTVIGILISAIGFFKLLPEYTHFTALKSAAPTAVAPEEKATTPHFDFYSLLPELEVTVPDTKETPAATSAQNQQAQEQDAQTAGNTTAYRLQLASFRSYKEADSFKAQMAMMGIEVEIEAVTLGPNDTWYRIRSLPYKTRESAQAARTQLQTQSIQSLLLEEKG